MKHAAYKLKGVMMVATQLGEVYRCEICGNTVEVIQNGAGTLVCCGEAMGKVQES